jgi:deoxyribose-phosphate aldolase
MMDCNEPGWRPGGRFEKMTTHKRNPGTPLDLDWVAGAHINKSAVERRTTSLTKRRTVES